MEAGKAWWQSQAMRAGLLAVIVGVAQIVTAFTGAEIDIELLRGYVDNGLGLMFGAATVVVGFKALVGRFKAESPIKKQVLPKKEELPWLKDKQGE